MNIIKSSDNLPDKLDLVKIDAYQIKASVSEKESEIFGYYKDYNIASIDSKGKGWYNSDGEVESVKVFIDNNGDIYHIIKCGKLTDVDREYKDKTLEKIKSKLTDFEIEFLQKNFLK